MHKVIQYIRTAYTEMTARVSWPTFAQIQSRAGIVLIASLIFALIIGGVDALFKNMMQFIYENL